MGHPPKYILKYVNVRLNMPMDGSEPKSSSVRNGVTRFAEISPLWQHFESLWQFLIRGGGLLSILPNCEPMLANVLGYLANFHC